MTHSFACPTATAIFLSRANPPNRVDGSTVTSAIFHDNMSAALKRLKRGKAAGPDEINKSLLQELRGRARSYYRDIFTPDGLRTACLRLRSVKRTFIV